MESFLRCALLIVPWLCPWLWGCGSVKATVPGVADPSLSESVQLNALKVKTIIAQAATEATKRGLPVTIAVVDHTGVVLGVLEMDGALTTTIPLGGGVGGLEGMVIDSSAAAAAISKAGTGAFFGTQGNAFTTRTASFIVQTSSAASRSLTRRPALWRAVFELALQRCRSRVRDAFGRAVESSPRSYRPTGSFPVPDRRRRGRDRHRGGAGVRPRPGRPTPRRSEETSSGRQRLGILGGHGGDSRRQPFFGRWFQLRSSPMPSHRMNR